MKREDVAHHDFENAEQLIKIYRTQIDVVLPTGTGVLNADDPNVVAIAEFCDGSVTFFSPDPKQPVIVAHLAEGHRAVTVEAGKIVLAQGVARTILCDVDAVSVTDLGRDTEQVRYVLAAAAAAWALKLPAELIQAGLEGFGN
jgi:cyanophycin synthetase